MKNYLLLVVATTLMTFFCLNLGYSNPSDVSNFDDFCDKISSDYTNFSYSNTSATLNFSSCASTCSSVSAGNDCGHAIYEGQAEFSGSATNSTTSGNGSGTGCQYYGFSSALELGAGTGTSYTYCTEYTANSEEASYVVYLSAANSSCLSKSVQVYDANTCGVANVDLEQPIGNYPAKATALRPGDSYTVCYTYTENGCVDDFQSSIFETCMSIVELPYCSSSPSPAPTMEICSGEDFEIDLGNACVADSDLTTGFDNGLSGYAAFYYQIGDRYVSFPEDMTAGGIGSTSLIKYFGESNKDNGGGCSPIIMNPIINTSCEPLEVVVGIIPVDVNSVDGPIINVLSDCKITEVTLWVYPQLTSQVTGDNIQLLTSDGTVCGTYSNIGSGNNGGIDSTPDVGTINPDTYIPRPVIGQNNFSNVVVIQNPFILGSANGPDEFNNSGTGFDSDNTGGIPDDILCVTGDPGLVNQSGETLYAHSVEVSDAGQLVFTYELPVQKAKLYPNPATSQLFFTTEIADTYTVRIYDTLGKQVFAGQTNNGAAIDIQYLSSGLYTYALEDNQQNVFDHGKWVKR